MTRVRFLCGLMLAAPILSAAALALPSDQIVTYYVHTTPTDPNSPVHVSISCAVHAVSSSGSTLGWQMTSLDVKEYNSGGTLINSWHCPSPTLSSSDGLWWTSHASINYPQPAEFTYMPSITASAAGVGPTTSSVNLDMGGTGGSSSCIYPVTFYTTFQIMPNSGGEVDGGTDVPVNGTNSGGGQGGGG